MTSHTILLHVSDRSEDVARAIGSARTLSEARPDADIRIIVNGAALAGLTRDAAELPDTSRIEACEGGLRSRDIPVDTLQPGIRTTASAVVALSDAQFDGAAYIRI